MNTTAWPPLRRAHALSLPPYEPEHWRFDPRFESWPQNAHAAQSLEQAGVFNGRYLWESERDHARALVLVNDAAEKNYFPGLLALADIHLHGRGVTPNPAHALELLDYAAWLGSASAYEKLATWTMHGWGVTSDTERAYALWQHAATLGCAEAQRLLGAGIVKRLGDEVTSGASLGRAESIDLAKELLNCALVQGEGDAALPLGQLAYPAAWANQLRSAALQVASEAEVKAMAPATTLSLRDAGYALAGPAWHRGVSLGSARCAEALADFFDTALVTDGARATRYRLLANALNRNLDLRLPNLDKVVPLPPVQLPKWNGDKKTLIDAAKGVVPAPVVKPTPGAKLTGRAHIPDGWLLPANPVPSRDEALGTLAVPPQYETTAARFSGYWLPQLIDVIETRHEAWNRAQVPLRYAQREAFEDKRDGLTLRDGRVMWHYMGVPVQQTALIDHPKVAQGVARYTRIPMPRQRCQGDAACPQTGIWYGSVPSDHVQAGVFNTWGRQAYVAQGAQFPDPEALDLNIAMGEVTWLWLDNANAIGFAGFAEVTLTDLHDPDGNPLA